eukprot:1155394-Pyramimonas_sp.AAC.1
MIVLVWGLVVHRIGQGTHDTSAQEQLVHDECQKKKEGTKFHIYMRSMSTWGPSAKLLLKRP